MTLSFTSEFLSSTLSVEHNAIKSLIFRAAELLFTLGIWKVFSLMAAKFKDFTSYLMFAEDPVQKSLYILSRGLSSNGMFLLAFFVIYSLAQLYGTLLWALDAPGYVARDKNVTADSLKTSLLEDPGYVTNLKIQPDSPGLTNLSITQAIGANLFKSGVNFTLTGDTDRGQPNPVMPTRQEVGPRIWVGEGGFSVSADTYVNVAQPQNSSFGPLYCPWLDGATNSKWWNCTFDNTYAVTLLDNIIGIPEVHWDDSSDLAYDSRYIRPNREDNVWAVFGQGAGTSVMKQVFTVAKKDKRHTFLETAFRATMFTNPGVLFGASEVTDFIKRTWSTNTTEQDDPIVHSLISQVLYTQSLPGNSSEGGGGYSFQFGLNTGTTTSVFQANWELLSPTVSVDPVYTVLRISVVNITLIRSETLAEPVQPYQPCDQSYQNTAYGGRLTSTDCAGASSGQFENLTVSASRFYGQVDTAAVLLLTGLGDGRSNVSRTALDPTLYQRTLDLSDTLDALLVSRAYILSVDPALVTLALSHITPALSPLQVLLVALAALFGAIAWGLLATLASAHYSAGLLANLVAATGIGRRPRSPEQPVDPTDTGPRPPGYMRHVPEIWLGSEDHKEGTPTAKAMTMETAEGTLGILPRDAPVRVSVALDPGADAAKGAVAVRELDDGPTPPAADNSVSAVRCDEKLPPPPPFEAEAGREGIVENRPGLPETRALLGTPPPPPPVEDRMQGFEEQGAGVQPGTVRRKPVGGGM